MSVQYLFMFIATYFDSFTSWNDEFVRTVINYRIRSKESSHTTLDSVLSCPFRGHAFHFDDIVLRDVHNVGGLKFTFHRLFLDVTVKILFVREDIQFFR